MIAYLALVRPHPDGKLNLKPTLKLTLKPTLELKLALKLTPDNTQVLMVAYLALVRPYPDWKLHWMEVSMHTLELGLFLFALSIIHGDKSTVGWSWAMIALFISAFAIIMLYELYFIITTAASAWKWVRTWWQAGRNTPAEDVDADRDTGETTATAPQLGGTREQQEDGDSPADSRERNH
jgi:hypothetical protein